MTSVVEQRVARGFVADSAGREYAKEYLVEVRANWRENEKSITRVTGLIIGAVALFLLLQSNDTNEFSILSVKIDNTEALKLALPPLVAYFVYQNALSYAESELFMTVHDYALKLMWPTLYEADLERVIHPIGLTGGTDRLLLFLGSQTRPGKLADLSGTVRVWTILLAPPIFLAFAYIQLFDSYGAGTAWLWVSLVASSALLGAALVNVYILYKVDSDEGQSASTQANLAESIPK